MKHRRLVETLVGFFMLLAIAGLVFLAFKVSGLTDSHFSDGYTISGEFDNSGSLKVRAPVKIGGVAIGQVVSIDLDPVTYRANVTLRVRKQFQIPEDSTANVYTEGLLGSNYINIAPGYSSDYMKPGDKFTHTQSAFILEKLIGQFLVNVKK